MNSFDEYIGLTIEELSLILKEQGKILRIVSIDGVPCIVTRDYRIDRVNVNLKNSRIESINGLG